MSRRDSFKVMRKEWWGGRSTHHDVILTIPVKKEHELLKIFRQLFSNDVLPISSVLQWWVPLCNSGAYTGKNMPEGKQKSHA